MHPKSVLSTKRSKLMTLHQIARSKLMSIATLKKVLYDYGFADAYGFPLELAWKEQLVGQIQTNNSYLLLWDMNKVEILLEEQGIEPNVEMEHVYSLAYRWWEYHEKFNGKLSNGTNWLRHAIRLTKEAVKMDALNDLIQLLHDFNFKGQYPSEDFLFMDKPPIVDWRTLTQIAEHYNTNASEIGKILTRLSLRDTKGIPYRKSIERNLCIEKPLKDGGVFYLWDFKKIKPLIDNIEK